jgi:hypothetical protein
VRDYLIGKFHLDPQATGAVPLSGESTDSPGKTPATPRVRSPARSADEQSDDLPAAGTGRRANADLTDPLPNRERDDGVEADGREQERESAGPAGGIDRDER